MKAAKKQKRTVPARQMTIHVCQPPAVAGEPVMRGTRRKLARAATRTPMLTNATALATRPGSKASASSVADAIHEAYEAPIDAPEMAKIGIISVYDSVAVNVRTAVTANVTADQAIIGSFRMWRWSERAAAELADIVRSAPYLALFSGSEISDRRQEKGAPGTCFSAVRSGELVLRAGSAHVRELEVNTQLNECKGTISIRSGDSYEIARHRSNLVYIPGMPCLGDAAGHEKLTADSSVPGA
jgi:hypothetical protein